MISARKLEVRCGDFVLGPIDLDLASGSYLTLLGPSGAGKTILLEALMGLRNMFTGKILIDGQSSRDLPPEQRHMAYLPQDLALFPHLSVRDNILFGARARRLPAEETVKRLKELTELLSLNKTLQRRDITTLSGGEQQRVALARALITQPQLLFLDEPHAALDAAITRQLQVKLRQINREFGVTIIHVTHDQEEAFMLGEQIIVLIDGKLQQIGKRDDIYYHPNSLRVARFLHHQNIFHMQVDRRLDNKRLRLKGELNLVCQTDRNFPEGTPVTIGIRNEEVTLVRPHRPIGKDLQDNLFDGSIVDILGFGGYHTLILKLVGYMVQIELDLPNCAFRDLGLDIGDRAQVSLRARCIWILPRETI